jgi:hypothetical protein
MAALGATGSTISASRPLRSCVTTTCLYAIYCIALHGVALGPRFDVLGPRLSICGLGSGASELSPSSEILLLLLLLPPNTKLFSTRAQYIETMCSPT